MKCGTTFLFFYHHEDRQRSFLLHLGDPMRSLNLDYQKTVIPEILEIPISVEVSLSIMFRTWYNQCISGIMLVKLVVIDMV